MDIKQLAPEISVTPQIQISDLNAIKAQGFRSIICNRPDGEGPDQPTFKQIEAAAAQAGLDAAYLPVAPGQMSADDADCFADLMSDLPRPVLAYCRTGARSAALWSMSQAKRQAAASRSMQQSGAPDQG